MKQVVSCRMPAKLVADLNQIAKEQHFPRSQLIRQMLSAYVDYLRLEDEIISKPIYWQSL